MLEDIAVLTGGQAIFEDLGIKLESLELKDLGSAKKVIVTKDTPPSSRAPARRRTSRPHRPDQASRDREHHSDYDREKLQERLAKLSAASP
jgi:chaperonin GroEL